MWNVRTWCRDNPRHAPLCGMQPHMFKPLVVTLSSIAFALLLPACTSSDEQDSLDRILAADPVQPDYSGKADGMSTDEMVALYCPGVDYFAGVKTYRGITGT